jgi:hypothetical protein
MRARTGATERIFSIVGNTSNTNNSGTGELGRDGPGRCLIGRSTPDWRPD